MAEPLNGLVLFDTDVLVDAGREIEDAVSALEQADQRFTPAVSTITQMELIVGCRDKAELRVLNRFLARFRLLPVDVAISARAVELLREYRLSHGLLIPDALIAATALTHRINLVSKNQRDYRFVQKLNLLPYPEPFASV